MGRGCFISDGYSGRGPNWESNMDRADSAMDEFLREFYHGKPTPPRPPSPHIEVYEGSTVMGLSRPRKVFWYLRRSFGAPGHTFIDESGIRETIHKLPTHLRKNSYAVLYHNFAAERARLAGREPDPERDDPTVYCLARLSKSLGLKIVTTWDRCWASAFPEDEDPLIEAGVVYFHPNLDRLTGTRKRMERELREMGAAL